MPGHRKNPPRHSAKADFKTAVYAGSFSPVTIGHHDIIIQAAKTFDRLYIVVGVSHNKTPLFTAAERVAMIERDLDTHIRPRLQQLGDQPGPAGLVSRAAAVIQLPILVGALIFVDFAQGYFADLSMAYTVFVLAMAIAVTVFGSGRFSVDHAIAKRADSERSLTAT